MEKQSFFFLKKYNILKVKKLLLKKKHLNSFTLTGQNVRQTILSKWGFVAFNLASDLWTSLNQLLNNIYNTDDSNKYVKEKYHVKVMLETYQKTIHHFISNRQLDDWRMGYFVRINFKNKLTYCTHASTVSIAKNWRRNC